MFEFDNIKRDIKSINLQLLSIGENKLDGVTRRHLAIITIELEELEKNIKTLEAAIEG